MKNKLFERLHYLPLQDDSSILVYMEVLIQKWIKETVIEYSLAKEKQNLYKMYEMKRLKNGLIELRDKLLKSDGV